MPVLDEAYRAGQGPGQLKAATSVDPDDWKWRRITAYGEPEGRIDLQPFKRDGVVAAVEDLFLSSPLGSRMIQWVLDFIVGSGFTISSPDHEADAILKAFWNAPENALQEEVRGYVQELAVYGELALAVGRNGADGHCSLSFIPSSQIEDVAEEEGLPGVVSEIKTKAGEEYTVIRWKPESQSYEGDCFFFRVNRLGGHIRGHPFLLPLIDWIRVWEKFGYNHLERSAHLSGIWWDVTLQGQTEEEIDAWMVSERAQPPKPGTVLGHNERVEWKLVQPQPLTRGMSDDANFFESFILGTAGLVNMSKLPSNIGEALDPVVRYLSSLRSVILSRFALLGKYELQEVAKAGGLEREDYKVRCTSPRIGVRDIQRSSGALSRITDSLVKVVERRWLTDDQASAIYKKLLHRLELIVDDMEVVV